MHSVTGVTPLMVAASRGILDLVELLLGKLGTTGGVKSRDEIWSCSVHGQLSFVVNIAEFQCCGYRYQLISLGSGLRAHNFANLEFKPTVSKLKNLKKLHTKKFSYVPVLVTCDDVGARWRVLLVLLLIVLLRWAPQCPRGGACTDN